MVWSDGGGKENKIPGNLKAAQNQTEQAFFFRFLFTCNNFFPFLFIGIILLFHGVFLITIVREQTNKKNPIE